MTQESNHVTSRRNFLKNSGLLGAGLVIGVSLNKAAIFLPDREPVDWEPVPFIVIDKSGQVTLVNPYPDMGQGSRQAIPTLIAEELEVSLEHVKIVQSDGSSKYGLQLSGGSGSVRRAWEPLRKAGAAAREMLVKAAASRWKLPVAECYAKNGAVFNRKNNSSINYGDLIEEASTFEVPQNPVLKNVSEFNLIGKPGKHPDMTAKLTGKAIYGIDVQVPEMVVAAILHSPTYYAKLIDVDDAAAKKIKGVVDVIRCERPMPHRTSDAVAVIATNYWAAMQGRKALSVKWEDGPSGTDAADYFQRMYDALKSNGLTHAETGDFEKHFVSPGSRTLEAVYETPFLAHAPMEPENAVVHIKEDGTVEVWAPVQSPDWARNDIAKYLDIIPEKIRINVTLSGGSFGRKSYHDYLLEACCLSKRLKRPVKVIWSREDDITQGPYRPAMLSRFQGVVNGRKITGLHHHSAGESIDAHVFRKLKPGTTDSFLCGEMANSYDLTASKISYTHVSTDIPIVWWRSVYASNFGFGQECFIDELAHLAHIDPLQARLDMLSDKRFIAVLETLAARSGYYDELPKGIARGIAIWKSFESISAACITVSKTPNGINIDKVVSVIDCGIYVNPDMVKAQTEGNIIMGLNAAIRGAITFKNGQCEQTNFHQYNILRMHEVPEMEVHIMENEYPPGGVGEPGLPPIAPALGNAIFNLAGTRIRKLPVDLSSI